MSYRSIHQLFCNTSHSINITYNDFIQFSSVSQLCLTLCNPRTAAHQASLSITNSWSLPAQTQVHRLGDGIQQSHPLSSPSPHAPNPSQHQSLFQWVTISASVIPFSSFLQPFPASGSFPVSQFFTPGGESMGVSASTSVLPDRKSVV